MTKSTITREQAQKIIVAADEVITALAGTNEDVHPDDSKKMCELWDDLNDRHAPPVVVRELARMALAAMDSEPVAWTWHYREQWHVTNDKCRAEFVAKDGDVAVLPLYRHAQPAPVVQMVPEEAPEHLLPKGNSRDTTYRRGAIILGWKLCRAAMLQAVPLTNEGDIQAGNSPAQSGCCPAQSPIDHGYRPECECSGCKATARICAELSANSSANPDCWCRTCRPVVLNDMRFVMCPDCGNKRCPRANDHRNACTGSNEPGQGGSAYPDTPREVKP